MFFTAVLYRHSYVKFKDSSRTDQMTTLHVTVKGQIMYFLVYTVSLNTFYFNSVRCKYKYIQVTECKRIRTIAGSLCYSSPIHR